MHQKGNLVKNLRFATIATDVALFTIHNQELLVRVIPVHRPPHYHNARGLPGGLILPHETAENAARRLLIEKGGITSSAVYLEQLATFSALDRDPRGRVIAVAHIGLVSWSELTDAERSTSDAAWVTAREARNLAYDHDEMLTMAHARLASRIGYSTIIRGLIPSEFTLTELEQAYECVLGRPMDKRNFRKKILKLDIIRPLHRTRQGAKARPAQLYAFAKNSIQMIDLFRT